MSFIHGFIELYDGFGEKNGQVNWGKAAVLECIWDGYPDAHIGFNLEDLLEEIHKHYKQTDFPDHWGSSDVATLMVKWTGEIATEVAGLGKVLQTFEIMPGYEPGLVHGYLWRIYLGPKAGQYEIRCFRVEHDWEKKTAKASDEEVDWTNWKPELGL